MKVHSGVNWRSGESTLKCQVGSGESTLKCQVGSRESTLKCQVGSSESTLSAKWGHVQVHSSLYCVNPLSKLRTSHDTSKRETDLSPQSAAQIKNLWSCTFSSSHTSAQCCHLTHKLQLSVILGFRRGAN